MYNDLGLTFFWKHSILTGSNKKNHQLWNKQWAVCQRLVATLWQLLARRCSSSKTVRWQLLEFKKSPTLGDSPFSEMTTNSLALIYSQFQWDWFENNCTTFREWENFSTTVRIECGGWDVAFFCLLFMLMTMKRGKTKEFLIHLLRELNDT